MCVCVCVLHVMRRKVKWAILYVEDWQQRKWVKIKHPLLCRWQAGTVTHQLFPASVQKSEEQFT